MRSISRGVSTAVLALAFGVAAGGEGGGVPSQGTDGDGFVRAMLVLGPFPNPSPPEGEKGGRTGFDRDWLADLGGEANPRVDADTVANYPPQGDLKGKAVAAVARGDRIVDWKPLFRKKEGVVAYGFADIESGREQDATCLFGSDDFAKVWLNGRLVFAHPAASGSRWTKPGEDRFPLKLRAGRNRLVVKVENGVGNWGVSVQILDAERLRTEKAAFERRDRIRRFANMPLRCRTDYGQFASLLAPGPFPEVVFENPELAALFLKPDTLKIRWFDPDLGEIPFAARPGFHCAYAEAELLDGGKYRRVVPVFVAPPGGVRFDRILRDHLRAAPIPRPAKVDDISGAAWDAQKETTRQLAELGWGLAMNDAAAALWLGELSLDKAPAEAWRETAYPNVTDYLVRLRRKVLDLPEAGTPLAPPSDEPAATALRFGTEEEAGFRPGAAARMREAFGRWRDATGNGFSVVVARHGVVALSEAFPGAKDGENVAPDRLTEGRLTVATRLPMASVTKLHNGVLLGRFLDQGLVGLDDPVSKFFPDWPPEGPKAVTVRQLMNHTAGLDGHRWWPGLDGMANPFLDNVALGELADAAPGTKYLYNGLDMDLGGKVMEAVAGKPAFRLMREGLLGPLGYDRSTLVDLGYGLDATALDLARLADMLRQGGAYGGKRYFRAETLALLLPRKVGEFNPAMAAADADHEYGVGVTWMRDPLPEPEPAAGDPDGDDDAVLDTRAPATREKDAKDAKYALGKNVFAHGSATGAVVRVAPDLDLIVTMARYTPGPDYALHLGRCMQAVAEELAPGNRSGSGE